MIVQFNNLQIIGIYIRPQCSADEVVEAIMSASELTDPEIPTLLAGDLNCRMDRPKSKSQALMELMEEEGFTLKNAAQTKLASHITALAPLTSFSTEEMS